MNNIVEHIARATSALEAGFTTKQAQQDALDQLNRGYEKARNWAHDRQISEAPDFEAGAWSEERHAFFEKRELPFQLNHVRERHLPILAEFVPGLDGTVRDLIALREKVKAAPVTKAPPKAAPAPSVEEGRMTCQICGRPILANTGRIAHHGYERPGEGWQTSSCPGALHLPFEASRDELGTYIQALIQRAHAVQKNHTAISDGEQEPVLTLTNYDSEVRFSSQRFPVVIRVSAETFEAAPYPKTLRTHGIRDFAEFKRRSLAALDREYSALRSAITQQEARFAAWQQTAAWVDGRWEEVR